MKTNYPKPIGYYTSEENEPLLFHMLDVGEGLMILIVFPDNTTMLCDCNVRQDDKDWIVEYLGKHIPNRYDMQKKEQRRWIDIFVNSHRDQDHYRGLSEINPIYEIKSIWDSGQTGATTQDDDYQYYMRLRRELINKYGNGAVKVPYPSDRPFAKYGEANVYCLCSSEEFNDTTKIFEFKEAKIQHTNSIVLSIQYAGRSILLTGDSDWKAWEEDIIPNFKYTNLLKSNILVASHHGSRSFFTDESENDTISPDDNPDTTYVDSIKYIQPSITLISCGRYEPSHHPNLEAMEIYKENTSHEQVYTTKEKGSFVGFIDMYGNWTVVPIRFCPKSNISNSVVSFDIKCIVNYEEKNYSGCSGDNFPIGCKLEFSVSSQGGIIEPFDMVDVAWEVSNGGIKDDHNHQEIYDKASNETYGKLEFHRDVAYEGKHLLRCRVKNKKKRVAVTKIFIVNGVHI